MSAGRGRSPSARLRGRAWGMARHLALQFNNFNMKVLTTIEFVVDTTQYDDVKSEAAIESLVKAMLAGEADWPNEVNIAYRKVIENGQPHNS
jgi:hypothetical protein